MSVIVDFLKLAARPSSVPFFIFALSVGLILALTRRHTRALRWYLAALFVGYWVLGAPACAEKLTLWSGRGYHPLVDAQDARGARVVVVLGAGSRTFQAGGSIVNMMSWEGVFRVMEGARLYRVLDQPTVILSGGITNREKGSRPESEGMRDAIVRLGVPTDHVVLESQSKTTHEEALIVRRMLADAAGQPIVIVTSPSHMRRAIAVFRSVGLNPVASVCAYKSDHGFEEYRWLPNQGALLLSDVVFYDTAAWWYYKARGWAN